MISLRSLLFLALPAVLLLSGCASTEEVKAPPSPYIQLSPVPPPANLREKPIRSENPQMEIWRRGYWSYDGKDFRWEPGHMMPRPDPTAVWCSDRWYKHSFGWGFIPGHWM